jgi:predicted nucleic acid-binding protein
MIILDANVVLEILERRPAFSAVQSVIASYGAGLPIAISTLTVSHIFYLAERDKIPTQETEELIAQYEVIDVIANDVAWALKRYRQKDFEDALQVAAAIRRGCTNFVTLDAGLAKKYRKHLNIALIQ